MIRWIVLEGGEGSGKTSLMKALTEEFERRDIPLLCTREPGGVPIAEAIRRIILDPENTELDPIAEALLFAASRRQHLVEKVLPALEEGRLVLMDRFVDSSLAYQGHARGIGIDTVRRINDLATEGRRPDLVVLLDLDPQEGLRRISRNQRESNRLDREKLRFHEKVREGYRILAEGNPSMLVLDAGRSTQELLEAVLREIARRD